MSRAKLRRQTNVTKSEWEKTRDLALKELRKLKKAGLLDLDEFDYELYDDYKAKEEVNRYVNSRLPYVD